MVSTKTRKDYRLSSQTLQQIEWLAGRIGGSATNVVEKAVNEMFEQERKKMRLKARPVEDGRYEISVDGLPIANVSEEIVDKLGKYKDQALGEGADENVFGLVFLLMGMAKGTAPVIFSENVQKVYDKMPMIVEEG